LLIATDITYLKDYQKQLEDSIDEKEVLIKEIHHRVKNNLAVVSGLLELQGLRVGDEQLSVILQESQARIKSIAMIHEKLYQSELFTQVDAGKYLQELTNTIAQAYEHPDRDIKLLFDLDSSFLNVNQAVPFAILANELISNSFKHAFDDQSEGKLEVSLKQDGPTLSFEISDDGKGLPDNFDPVQEGSLGFTLILNLAEQLDGNITWQNNGSGAAFKLIFDPNEAARTWASSGRS
jgi:two-component sensor histidine kinase